MELVLQIGYFDDYETDMPALQPLVNVLEDILGMDVEGMGSFQDPPIIDNFTQLWREYLQTLCSAPKPEGQEKRELPDLSVELVLCTDVYLKVQEVVALAEPNIIRDDYKNNWAYKNYYANDHNSGHILELLKQYPFTSNSFRKTLTSFFRSDTDIAKVVDWHTTEKFWFRRVSMKEKITGIRISGREDCAVGVSRWDWPRYNPFLAGLIAFVVAQAVDEFNTVTQNHSGSPVETAHLYNYLRQAHSVTAPSPCTPVLAKEWPDMETYLKIMGDKSVFGGDRPWTLRHCLQRIFLAHGRSLSSLARNAHGANDWGIKTKTRLQSHNTPIIDALCEGGTQRRNFLNITNKTIQEVIQREATRRAATSTEQNQFPIKTLTGYLTAFRRTLQYEIPRMHFMHSILAIVAHWLHNKLKDPLRALSEENGNGYTPPAWDNEDTIPLHIIWHESRHQERTSSLNYETREVNSQPTYTAASVIEETLLSSNSRPKVPSFGTRKFEEMVKYVYPTINHCVYAKD